MENAVILDVEATPTRTSKEVDATETMIERVEERFALKPDHVAGDVAYGTGDSSVGWWVATSTRTSRSGIEAKWRRTAGSCATTSPTTGIAISISVPATRN